VHTESEGDFGVLIVSDDGSAIPEDLRERIFLAYDRGAQGPSDVPSLGLGLHICRTLARLMDGDLVYRYRSGRSEFVLTLPLRSDVAGR
jgi:signal transduction histidine kinase